MEWDAGCLRACMTYSFVQWIQTLVACEKVSENSTVEEYYNDQNLNKSIIVVFKPKKQTDFSPIEMQCFENHKNIHELNSVWKKKRVKTSPTAAQVWSSSFNNSTGWSFSLNSWGISA